MQKTISATEARVHLGDVLDQVEQSGARFVIERGGKLAAVIVSLPEFEKLGEPEFDGEALIERANQNGKAIAEWRTIHQPGEPWPDFVQSLNDGREERDAQLLEGLL